MAGRIDLQNSIYDPEDSAQVAGEALDFYLACQTPLTTSVRKKDAGIKLAHRMGYR
jgi:hypothetical protein